MDRGGRVHIIELKLGPAMKPLADQMRKYLIAVQLLTRADLIRLGDAGTPGSFELRYLKTFGEPLPATINHSQVLTTVALSAGEDVLRAMEPFTDVVHAVKVFDYTFQEPKQPLGPAPEIVSMDAFWREHRRQFVWDALPFSFLLQLYWLWAAEHRADTPRPPDVCTHLFRELIDEVTWLDPVWGKGGGIRRAEVEADEPLMRRVPRWRRPDARQSVGGLRRRARGRNNA